MDSWIALDTYDISSCTTSGEKLVSPEEPSSTTSCEGDSGSEEVPKSDVGGAGSPQLPSQSHEDSWKDLPCDIDLDSLLFLKPKDMEEIMDRCEWVSLARKFPDFYLHALKIRLYSIVYDYTPEVYDMDFRW